MLHALITQREGHNMYGKYTDVLEAAYVEFYESLGIRLRPVSNFTKNFDEIVDEQFDLLIVTGGGTLHPRHYVEPHNAELQPHRDALEAVSYTHLDVYKRQIWERIPRQSCATT